MIDELDAYGYREADHSPLHHHCSDNLVDVVVKPPAIVLVCYTCRRWWRTGLGETGTHKSLAMLVAAADRLYRQEAA